MILMSAMLKGLPGSQLLISIRLYFFKIVILL